MIKNKGTGPEQQRRAKVHIPAPLYTLSAREPSHYIGARSTTTISSKRWKLTWREKNTIQIYLTNCQRQTKTASFTTYHLNLDPKVRFCLLRIQLKSPSFQSSPLSMLKSFLYLCSSTLSWYLQGPFSCIDNIQVWMTANFSKEPDRSSKLFTRAQSQNVKPILFYQIHWKSTVLG